MLLREAMNFVKSNTKRGREKLPDGRKNKPEYAERAVLQARRSTWQVPRRGTFRLHLRDQAAHLFEVACMVFRTNSLYEALSVFDATLAIVTKRAVALDKLETQGFAGAPNKSPKSKRK